MPLTIHGLSKFPTLFVRASRVLRIIQVLEKPGGQDPVPQGIYILFGGDKQQKQTSKTQSCARCHLRVGVLF